MKDPNISLKIAGRPLSFMATVDTGSPVSFFSSDAVRVPPGARRGRYTIGGKTWRGHFAPVRVQIANGCEITAEAFIAPKAPFNVVGTDVLQGLRCRVNLKSHKLTCPPSGKIKGCSIPMFQPQERYDPTPAKRGRKRRR